MTITQKKQEQRLKAQRRRETLPSKNAGLRAAEHFLKHVPVNPTDIVALYYPFGNELDTLPLLDRLAARGVQTALPVVLKKDCPLEFRLWENGDPLEAAAYGIPAPPQQAKCVIPDIVIVPLLAFDQSGSRMGYGGGFYDRTLAQLRAMRKVIAVGYAHSGQQVEKVITDPLDQNLDWVVTEQTARKFQ